MGFNNNIYSNVEGKDLVSNVSAPRNRNIAKQDKARLTNDHPGL